MATEQSSSASSSTSSSSNKRAKIMEKSIRLTEEEAQDRLDMIRRLVAKPIPEAPWTDPQPALIEGGRVLIGNKHHAADVENLLKLGVTAVLNCASGGISRLPVDKLKESGITYTFTNVNQDNYSYPILHDYDTGECSKHLQVAKDLYHDVVQSGGKVLFFCVAGQNRSATLSIAVMMLFGHSLETILESCAKTRSFILENVGFQQQLVELEEILKHRSKDKIRNDDGTMSEWYRYGTVDSSPPTVMTKKESDREASSVEIELLIPGLCTMDVKIPVESTIEEVKHRLVDHANKHLLAYSDSDVSYSTIAKSWVVLAMFGYDSMYDFPLEVEAIELSVQLDRMKTMFNLEIVNDGKEQRVRWTQQCRFALVIFSVMTRNEKEDSTIQEPWTFVHEERQGAPATLLENALMSTSLRAWDFVTGQAFCSDTPIVFSFAPDPRDKRQFMKISTSAHEAQQFHAPGEGGILGMGNNAIVHRVELLPTSSSETEVHHKRSSILGGEEGWDAAVKRPFSLSKMLAALENSSEAGLAKRMRFANSLNSDGRVLFFYGLGVALSANAYNHQEYKFEATLLARYEEEFSTYTMKRFMDDYIATPSDAESTPDRVAEIESLQAKFSLISVKVFLVSLLNAFRDLTLMGVQAFDFNHMNNVLVSRDHRTVRLIDIDGNSKGSIQFPSEYIQGAPVNDAHHKPSLDIDLNTVLPVAVQQLILGKGRGFAFVRDKKSEIWRASPEDAKKMIKDIIRENFFSNVEGDEESDKAEKHICKVAEWFYILLKKSIPWDNWTNDIYDAMRCIDHLPIT